ncbi:MAG: hypothetical protein VX871_05030 [Pseudomonadota bacterium]|nr:hypothetical protein [Pseudomonadota bacterium]
MASRDRKADLPDSRTPANEPALLSRDGLVSETYHYWLGASGERYLHTVYALRDCPVLPKANFILVRREATGVRRPLAIGQTVTGAASLNLAHLRREGARSGANEVHIHLLAETGSERDWVESDLRARQFGKATLTRRLRPANDYAEAAIA